MTPNGNTIRGVLRLIAPWLQQITAANAFDSVIAGNFIGELRDIADQLDGPPAEVRALDPHPGPAVRSAFVPGNAAPQPAPIGAEIVSLFPRVQE